MADSPRIQELKRRVQGDPASIAFAALAEEYRRAERYQEAIDTCSAGLVRHPSYLSAHVTLGRALMEMGRLQEAQQELEFVLQLAPENLAAIRGLAEIHHRLGDEQGHPPITPPPAPEPRHAEEPISVAEVQAASGFAVAEIAPQVMPPREDATLPALQQPTLPAVQDATLPAVHDATLSAVHDATLSAVHDATLPALEHLLSAIQRARAARAAAR